MVYVYTCCSQHSTLLTFARLAGLHVSPHKGMVLLQGQQQQQLPQAGEADAAATCASVLRTLLSDGQLLQHIAYIAQHLQHLAAVGNVHCGAMSHLRCGKGTRAGRVSAK